MLRFRGAVDCRSGVLPVPYNQQLWCNNNLPPINTAGWAGRKMSSGTFVVYGAFLSLLPAAKGSESPISFILTEPDKQWES